MPAKGVEAAHVGEFAQGAIGLGGVLLDSAAIADRCLEQLGLTLVEFFLTYACYTTSITSAINKNNV